MNFPDQHLLNTLQQMRRHIHQHPELSGHEHGTAEYIADFLEKFEPTTVLRNLGGGTGLLALWESGRSGNTIFFRTELDALPIQERNEDLTYCSQTEGVAHKCGHDGHMMMVAGLAPLLQHRNFCGTVGLLFQPAEETGEGAAALVNDQRFRATNPDYIFGLHNLPGFPLGLVVVRNGGFCAASCGMCIEIEGRTSHAAEPEKAHSPAAIVSQLMTELPLLPRQIQTDTLALATLTHVQLGEPSFGITPGKASIYLTLRAFMQKDLDALQSVAKMLVQQLAKNFTIKIDYKHVFPATVNHPDSFSLFKTAAAAAQLQIAEATEPFRWSEDFGHYSAITKTGFFGLGSGIDQPNLHHPMYDFPDALLPYGIEMYAAIIDTVNA